MSIDPFRKIPEFLFLNETKLLEIANHAVIQNYAPGQVILKEGELADAFYVIIDGDVRVFTIDAHKKKIVLERLQGGNSFGEQAFSPFVSPRRTASAEAISQTSVYQIPRHVLSNLERENVNLRNLLRERFNEYVTQKVTKLAGGSVIPFIFQSYWKREKNLRRERFSITKEVQLLTCLFSPMGRLNLDNMTNIKM